MSKKQLSPGDVLRLMHTHKLEDSYIETCTKEELAAFVLMIFKGGILDRLLNIKR